MKTAAEFLTKVNRHDGRDDCWLWAGSRIPDGYGNLRWGERNQLAHRVSYELFIGPIPEGLQLDHLCRIRECVNPEHLEPVTNQENARRGVNAQSLKTHCPHGHEYTPENIVYASNGGRQCRVCKREWNRRWREAHPKRAA